MIKALLFDLDGVLVDAMDWHETAFLAAVRAEGKIALTTEEHREHLAGLPTKVKLQHLVKEGRLDAKKVSAIMQAKQRITMETIETRCHPDPRRINLLTHLRGEGYKLGCVTNCIRQTTRAMLGYSALEELLPVVVTNEDVHEPKPDPEGYLVACGMLATAPGETLAFEDHPHGIHAAAKAGCHVYPVRTYDSLTINTVWTAILEANLEEGSG